MSMINALLQELEQEAAVTRRVLERVPADRLTWKPHDKSMSLGQLALHVATVPGAIAEIAATVAVSAPRLQSAESSERRGAAAGARREHRQSARASSAGMDDAALAKHVAGDARRPRSHGDSGRRRCFAASC